MNLKKLGVYGFLALMLVMPLVMAVESSYPQGFTFLKYLFGEPSNVAPNATSGIIITIAVWILIWVTFSDVIATFSTFSPFVSWTAGAMIGIIAANLGLLTGLVATLTGIFAFAGTVAIYIGLGAAFVAFIAVNLGLTSLRKWILTRKAMMDESTAKAGGYRIAGGIEGLEQVTEALGASGKKVGKTK